MADSRFSKSGNRRDVITQPNTKSSHYSSRTHIIPKIKSVTCKVRACKVRNIDTNTGYCARHTKGAYNNEELYDKCRECSELVTDLSYGLTCGKCDFWYHTKCVGITNEQYKCLIGDNSREVPEFHWYCRFCKHKCIEAVAKIDLLESQTRNLASKLTKLDERVNVLEGKIPVNVKDTVRSQLQEKSDIERRKFNVIVFNMPEIKPQNNHSDKPDSVWQTYDKKKRDTEVFCKILEEALDVDVGNISHSIKDAVRIGPIRTDKRPRLLRVTFHDLNMKREVLGKAKLLNRGKYNSIYINPDLTPQQRKIDSELRAKLKTRKNQGEQNLVIRRGKIEIRKDENGKNAVTKDYTKPVENETDEDNDLSMADLEDERSNTSESDSDKEITLESISSATEDSQNSEKENKAEENNDIGNSDIAI